MNILKHNIPSHFTASGLVLGANHILLVNHKRIGAWVPPGGHIEIAEMPHEAAIREVFEETGIDVEIISESIPNTEDPDAFFLYNPLCLQSVKAIENGSEYYHIDIVYLCCPKGLFSKLLTGNYQILPKINTTESHDARWIALSDIANFNLAKNVKEALHLAIKKSNSPYPLENLKI